MIQQKGGALTLVSTRLLRVDVENGDFELETIDKQNILGPIDLGVELHLERYKSYLEGPFSPKNVLILGFGPFSLSKIFGSNRMVAVFRSPVTMGIHVSSMGGAAWNLARSGIDALAIEGKSDEPAIILIEGNGKDISVRKNTIDWRDLERFFMPKIGGHYGTLAIFDFIEKKYSDFISKNRARIIAVGPASMVSRSGGLFSKVPNSSARVLDSASRGGGGSVLFRAHGTVAIVMGGKVDKPRRTQLIEFEKVKPKLEKKLEAPLFKAVMKSTRKYRFEPSLNTGGTFGVNYVHYRELIPMYNFNSIYYTFEVRVKLHSVILKEFWDPFQDEVFKGSPTGKWMTCGEPCPVACKKIWRGEKIDYEPLHAMGPMVGIFRLEDAVELAREVDALGADAIEAGHTVAWIFDMIERGLMEPEDVNLPFRPRFNPLSINPSLDSHHNATLVKKILIDIYSKGSEGIARIIAKDGLRKAALELDERRPGIKDLLLYASFGEKDIGGYMTPNYYWSPGMIAPLYILGRYWTNYAPTFQEPEDYAETSLRRAFAEYSIDNAGACRFHRGWMEKILEELYSIIDVDVDIYKHSKEGYKKLATYQRLAKAEPVPWESSKAFDLLVTIADEVGAKDWVEKMSKNAEKALEWWTKFKKKVDEILFA